MTVRVTYHCGGCDATATASLRRRHEGVKPAACVANGVVFDRCLIVTDDVETAAPDGWIVFDPYTFCTYCPSCWSQITDDGAGDDRD